MRYYQLIACLGMMSCMGCSKSASQDSRAELAEVTQTAFESTQTTSSDAPRTPVHQPQTVTPPGIGVVNMDGRELVQLCRELPCDCDEAISAACHVPLLHSVHLVCSSVTKAGLSKLAAHAELEFLSIAGCPLTSDGLTSLASCQNLKQLAFNGSQLSDAGLKTIGSLGRLERLCIGGTRLTGSGLRHLHGLRNLKYLGIGSDRFEGEYVASITRLTTLTSLSLNTQPLSPDSLEQLSRCVNLETLSISATRVDVKLVSALATLMHLQDLTLENGTMAAGALRPLSRTNIKRLAIERAEFADSGLGALGDLQSLSTLRLYDVRAPSDVDGAQVSAEMRKLAGLKQLHITQSALPVSAFRCIEGLAELQGLSLCDTWADDSLLEAIGSRTKLRSLDIRSTAITPDGESALRKRLPNTSIQFSSGWRTPRKPPEGKASGER